MNWKTKFKCVLDLQTGRNSNGLVFFALMEIIISLGIVIGYSYLYSTPGTNDILYLATGAPTIVIIMTSLVILPQQNASAKTEGYIDFIKSLPVSRKMFLFVDVLIWTLITIPGIVISTLVANLMFHPGYSISWTIIPAFFLIVLSSFGIGYGFSFVMEPLLAMALSQIIAFVSLMFSPINYPIDRLPEWMQLAHKFLPIYPMAEVMRGALAQNTFDVDFKHYIVLVIWSIIGFGGAIKFLEKNY